MPPKANRLAGASLCLRDALYLDFRPNTKLLGNSASAPPSPVLPHRMVAERHHRKRLNLIGAMMFCGVCGNIGRTGSTGSTGITAIYFGLNSLKP